MSSTISLAPQERKALLHLYRQATTSTVAHRAHILLLLDDGYAWDTIATVLYTSASTIARWPRRFQIDGLQALGGQRPGHHAWFAAYWIDIVARWVTVCTPHHFGLLRSRWTCAAVAWLLLTYCELA